MAERSSRKRRKERQRTAAASASESRGYARSRAKDEAVRASLKPLRPGERPAAVTVGAVAAALLAVANVVALVAGFEVGETQMTAGSLLVTGVLVLVAFGMWRARYWAVLGMQTLLGLTIVLSALGLLTALNWLAAILLVAIIAAAGTLFWFLVKAMARIQMPQRPGAEPR